MTVIVMSHKELARLEVLRDLEAGRISANDAASLMAVSRRHAFRLLAAFRRRGPEALVSARRGRPSNRRLPDELRRLAVAIVRERYADFGPTLAAEKLAERHGLSISRETLRQWMIAEGLWLDRRRRLPPLHQPRPRRECPGELVQIDGCEHGWFEDRGPRCTLLVFVDDATSRLMLLRFVASESAFDYFRATRTYLETHGKPVAFYSDKHTVFRVAKVGATRGDGMTQFGRALHELNVDILCADRPQAKGRVERAHKTLQDRLVKELRLAGASTIEAANALLPAFIAAYNARFAKPPRSDRDLHRPLLPTDDLDEIMAWREERTVSSSLTLQYDKVLFLLEPNAITRPLARQRVTVVNYPDGRFAIRHRGVDLPFRPFDKLRQVDQAAVVANKRLGAALAHIRERQATYGPAWNRAQRDRRHAANNLLRPGLPSG